MSDWMRTVNVRLPDQVSVHEGLAYSLWLPQSPVPVRGGVVVLHGAGSCKENHHDFARSLVAAGFAALVFDQRGHGASGGTLDARALQDVAMMADVLRQAMAQLGGGAQTSRPAEGARIALRGSSTGGYLAILAASLTGAAAVVAVCPASAQGLSRGLASGQLGFDADRAALEGLLSGQDLHRAVAELTVPLLLLHAEGDEQVPVQHSQELAQQMSSPHSRLVVVPGGHHRSVQHDPELNALTLSFLKRALAEERPEPGTRTRG